MIEISNEIPFLWRLSPESSDGYCSVALVVPHRSESDIQDLTIETGILSLSSGNSSSETEEVLEWNQDDISLFLTLINQRQAHGRQMHPKTLRVDLADPEVIEIIHIVAAAGFGVAFTSQGLLKESQGLAPLQKSEIGALASLDTISGFIGCVVVDLEDEDVVCVLLNEISGGTEDSFESIHRHDLLLVNKRDLLNPEFAEDCQRPLDAILH